MREYYNKLIIINGKGNYCIEVKANLRQKSKRSQKMVVRYDTIEEINVDSKAEYTA